MSDQDYIDVWNYYTGTSKNYLIKKAKRLAKEKGIKLRDAKNSIAFKYSMEAPYLTGKDGWKEFEFDLDRKRKIINAQCNEAFDKLKTKDHGAITAIDMFLIFLTGSPKKGRYYVVCDDPLSAMTIKKRENYNFSPALPIYISLLTEPQAKLIAAILNYLTNHWHAHRRFNSSVSGFDITSIGFIPTLREKSDKSPPLNYTVVNEANFKKYLKEVSPDTYFRYSQTNKDINKELELTNQLYRYYSSLREGETPNAEILNT